MLSNADVLNAEAGGEESGIDQLTRAGLNFDEFEDEDDEDEEVAVINVTAFGYAEEEAHDDLGAALRASGYHVELGFTLPGNYRKLPGNYPKCSFLA